MTLDGVGFRVDVHAVEEAAKGIIQSVEDQDNFELRGLCGEAEQYGNVGLREALMEYCVRWSSGLDTLTEDAEAIGETLAQVAQVYRGIDGDAARTLTADPAVQAVYD